MIKIISVREHPDYKDKATHYFQSIGLLERAKGDCCEYKEDCIATGL